MNILTDEELGRLLGFGEFTTESTKVTLENIARAIESAVLAKLTEQVGEPAMWTHRNAQGVLTITDKKPSWDETVWPPVFTKSQLLAAQQRTAEACAKYVVSGSHDDDPYIISGRITGGEWREYL